MVHHLFNIMDHGPFIEKLRAMGVNRTFFGRVSNKLYFLSYFEGQMHVLHIRSVVLFYNLLQRESKLDKYIRFSLKIWRF